MCCHHRTAWRDNAGTDGVQHFRRDTTGREAFDKEIGFIQTTFPMGFLAVAGCIAQEGHYVSHADKSFQNSLIDRLTNSGSRGITPLLFNGKTLKGSVIQGHSGSDLKMARCLNNRSVAAIGQQKGRSGLLLLTSHPLIAPPGPTTQHADPTTR